MVIGITVVFSLILTVNDGTLPTFLAEIFPTQVRYSGFALSFNAANAFLGGTAPLVATSLIAATGNDAIPAWYLTMWAVLALIAMLMSKETAFLDPGTTARSRASSADPSGGGPAAWLRPGPPVRWQDRR